MSAKTLFVFGAVAGAMIAGAAWLVSRPPRNPTAHPHGQSAATTPTQPAPFVPRPPTQSSEADLDADPVMSRVVRSGPMARPRDAFRVITRPKFLTVEEAGFSMSDEEVVLGLELEGQCRAYPINYLNDHELVREEIGRLPLLISW